MVTKRQEDLLDLKLDFQKFACKAVNIAFPLVGVISEYKKLKIVKSMHRYTYAKHTDIVGQPALVMAKPEIDYSRIKNRKAAKIVEEFIGVLSNHFPPEVLDNFYRNINNTKLVKKFFHRLVQDNGGFYDPEQKGGPMIQVEDYCNLYHELFHLASSILLGNIFISGFQQDVTKEDGKRTTIGSALNEGYTEVMSRRYFGSRHAMLKDAYVPQRIISERLEDIIGREKMEVFYLSGNLSGLIEELKKYASVEEIMSFLYAMDLTLSSHEFSDEDYEKNQGLLKVINAFLVKTFDKKQTMRVANGEITDEERADESKKFVRGIITEATIGGRVYDGHCQDLSFMKIMLGIEGEYETQQMRDLLDYEESLPRSR